MFVIRDKEAGNFIEAVYSMEEGAERIKEYEEQDKKDGTYSPSFYEIVDAQEAGLTWAIFDITKTDEWIRPCNSLEEAIEEGNWEWDMLTKYDKKKRVDFFVGLARLDKNGEYIELPDGTIDSDIYVIARKWTK